MVYIILGLLIIFLFFFCLYLRKKNQNLSKKIQELEVSLELERKNQDIASVKYLSSNKIPIKEISKDIEEAINESEKIKDKEQNQKQNFEEEKIDKILEKSHPKYQFKHVYEKNILESIPSTLSSVKICNNETQKKDNKKGERVAMNEVNGKVNLNDFIKRDRGYIHIVPEEKKEEPPKQNISFVEEISKKLESQLGPQTIELTDYEKEQEETAIISYKELLKVKEQLYEENVAKENEEFLRDLKAFRSNLG